MKPLTVVTCEIKHWNYFKIISALFHMKPRLKLNIILAAEIISKLFQRKYSWAAISVWNNFEIISGKIISDERNTPYQAVMMWT